MGKLLAVVIGIPLIEILILIKLGEAFGFLPTVLIVFGTGIAGAWAAKLEGLRIFTAIRKELSEGRLPGEKMLDGFLIFIAGMFLILPGLLTDLMGIILLIPATRNQAKGVIRRKLEKWLQSNRRGGPSDVRYYVR